ncbi:MAG: helix-turn-helix transcriptional regulator [Clostridia bacterium]|nr:helix-turn-helix transcriptional regulator [Clostridia bacterium]
MKELGKYIGLSESAVSMYANNKRQPDCLTLSKIAEFFSVSTDYLLCRTDVKKMASDDSFNNRELNIITAYRTLSNEGQFEVDRFLEYAQERYKKDSPISIMANR